MSKDELLNHVKEIREYINRIGEVKYTPSTYILRLYLEMQLNSLATTLLAISNAEDDENGSDK